MENLQKFNLMEPAEKTSVLLMMFSFGTVMDCSDLSWFSNSGNSYWENVIKLFMVVVMNFHNKLEGLLLAGLSNLVYCLWTRPGAYP
jgi:hypothetical protein